MAPKPQLPQLLPPALNVDGGAGFDADDLKGARDLCRSPDLMKKQCVVGSTQLQNRCLLRHRLFHLPAAYPRIDLASLIQTDPQCFWITGRLSSVYHRCHLLHRGLDTSSASP